MTTVLHVEDDPMLAEMVRLSFETFGFRGESLVARDVQEAREILADCSHYPGFELVLTDMNLPDGTGLDVVRALRANPSRAHIPVLILSGDIDRSRVDSAYALGANSYVSKGAGARSMHDVLRALYDHWLRDALLPANGAFSRTHRVLRRGIGLRSREADFYAQVSAALVHDGAASSFWMSMALKHGNLANLWTFLDSQLGGRELDDALLDEATRIQDREEPVLFRLEREMQDHPTETEKIARRGLLELSTSFAVDDFVRITSQLFPVMPTAASALRDLVTGIFDTLVIWFDHTEPDSDNQARVARLREMASNMRKLDDLPWAPSAPQV
ncbi:MAG: response regulator [Kofleriaceae bacterium]|nr:response regulator [Kofleriaceae bacterium]